MNVAMPVRSREVSRSIRQALRGLACLAALAAGACGDGPKISIDYSGPTAEWRDYGGDKGGLKYSPLTQINRENVKALRIAWQHRSGDFSDGKSGISKTALQVTPLVVGDTLYYCTPFNRIFALDAETGKQRWVFDPAIKTKQLPFPIRSRAAGSLTGRTVKPAARRARIGHAASASTKARWIPS